MEILIQKPWDYTFSKKDSGEYLLSVMCGSVGLFDVDIILNVTEATEFDKTGTAYVDQLAAQIRRDPNNWQSRKVN